MQKERDQLKKDIEDSGLSIDQSVQNARKIRDDAIERKNAAEKQLLEVNQTIEQLEVILDESLEEINVRRTLNSSYRKSL